MDEQDTMLRDMLRSFRQREIEPCWEQLDRPEQARLQPLWSTLAELGATGFGLDEDRGGMPLSGAARLTIMRELGAACPALGVAVLGHAMAQQLMSAAAGRAELPEAVVQGRLSLVGDALAATPPGADGALALWTDDDGRLRLRGALRVAWPHPTGLCIPAALGTSPMLVFVPVGAAGLRISPTPSSHGLCLMQFGMLSLDDVVVPDAHAFAWPAEAATAAARQADALLAVLLAGVLREVGQRAGEYALQRFQGGKMIHEHDAVRQLVGPIEVGRRAIEAFAAATFDSTASPDGAASAFAVDRARQACLDAVQVLGGNGYMEDYRVERYLRDVGTTENHFVHAEARRRAVAASHFARLAS